MQILFLQKCITNMQNPISRQHCRHIVHSIVKSNPLHNLKSSFEIIRHIFRWSCWDNLRRLPFRWASGITTKSILVKCSLFFGYYRTAVFSLCTLIGAVYRAAVFLLVYIDWYCVQGSCFSPCLHWLVECTGQLFFSLFTLIGTVYRAAVFLLVYIDWCSVQGSCSVGAVYGAAVWRVSHPVLYWPDLNPTSQDKPDTKTWY